MLGKRYLIIGIIGVFICLMSVQPGFAQLKIGFIDSQRILASLPSAIEARQTLEEESNAWRDELQQMEEELRMRQEQIEQQSMLLSEAKKQEKAEEFQALLLQAQQFQNEKWGEGGEFFKRQTELLQPVYTQINAAIQSLRKQENYDFILDAANLLDADEKYNLTDKLLEELGVESSS